jgi:hypothetical protein
VVCSKVLSRIRLENESYFENLVRIIVSLKFPRILFKMPFLEFVNYLVNHRYTVTRGTQQCIFCTECWPNKVLLFPYKLIMYKNSKCYKSRSYLVIHSIVCPTTDP